MIKQYIYPTIQLTDNCNKQCGPCLRSANNKGFNLTYPQFLNYIKDLKIISKVYDVSHQFLTGGEPTIWQDKNKDKNFINIIEVVSKLKFVKNLVLPTNGKIFEDQDKADVILTRLAKVINEKFILALSIADYQKNFIDNCCKPLDNIINFSTKNNLDMNIIILVTLPINSDIDIRIKKKYPTIHQRVTPLVPLGNAKNKKNQCPLLCLSNNDKSSLGSFLPHFKQDALSKLNISESKFYKMPNLKIMDLLSTFNHCGQGFFVDNKWHFCLPFLENCY